MTTQQLTELQRSITGTRWILDRAGVNVMDANEPLYCLAQCHESTLPKLQANAQAIALVPELIAEVIRLREALSNALNVMAGVATGDLKTIKPDSNAIAIARAALANDK